MTLAVFFPSLMGFGILVSGVLLAGDFLHRIWPRSTSRRDHRIAAGAYAVVESVARAGRAELGRASFLIRVARARWVYATWALLCAAAAALGWFGPMALYRDPIGVFADSPWIIGIAYGTMWAFGAAAGLCALLAVVQDHGPRWLRVLIAETPIGRFRIPGERGFLAELIAKGDDR